MLLTAIEARVLGSLMEKESTTPELYPLSLHALAAACNQKSSRDPVLQLAERDIHVALRSLEDKDLVSIDHGSRVERYENRARTVFSLRRDEAALLCLLLLRGPQTPGELRGRADRLFTFDDVSAVLATLHRMAGTAAGETGSRDPLVASLPRQPGAREQRSTHLLCGLPHATASTNRAEANPAPAGLEGTLAAAINGPSTELHERVADLQHTVQSLQQRVAALEQALHDVSVRTAADR